MITSLGLLLSENVFSLILFLKNIFIWYRILGWVVLFFNTLMVLLHCLLGSVISDEKSVISNNCSPLCECVIFFLEAFKIFSLRLIFNTVTMTFLLFILPGVHWTWIYKFMSFKKFGVFFNHCFSKHFFPSSLSSHFKTSVTKCFRFLRIAQQFPEILFIKKLFYRFRLDNFYWSISDPWTPSSVYSVCKPIWWCF